MAVPYYEHKLTVQHSLHMHMQVVAYQRYCDKMISTDLTTLSDGPAFLILRVT